MTPGQIKEGRRAWRRGVDARRRAGAAIGIGLLVAGPGAAVAGGQGPGSPTAHFYSTARPPLEYPGPIPVTVPVAADPALASTAPAPAPEPMAPIASPEPIPDPAVAPAAAPSPAPEPEPEPIPDPVAADSPPAAADTAPSPERPAEVDPIAQAKALIRACAERYNGLSDYTCTFMKRERIGGRLSGYHVMSMKARTRPHSVYFRFRQPHEGREAIYVHGRHGGDAVVHDVGIGKLVAGTVRLDPRGSRAMEGNRHPITEAGIGYMIASLIEGWDREMNHRDSVVEVRPGVLVNKRPCTMIISNHPRHDREYTFHEVRVYIDQELGLPIRFEAYDWPRRPGEAGALLEEYTYLNLKTDVGLSNADFDPSNKAYSFGRF